MAPGTAGSLLAAVLIWLIPFSHTGLLVALVVTTVAGLWAGGHVERLLGAKDPGIIVIDEVAGMLLSVLLLPRTLTMLATAFVLFRLFDIWKPFPARQSQRLGGGLGVMIDDLIAGAYALVLLLVARRVLGVPP